MFLIVVFLVKPYCWGAPSCSAKNKLLYDAFYIVIHQTSSELYSKIWKRGELTFIAGRTVSKWERKSWTACMADGVTCYALKRIEDHNDAWHRNYHTNSNKSKKNTLFYIPNKGLIDLILSKWTHKWLLNKVENLLYWNWLSLVLRKELLQRHRSPERCMLPWHTTMKNAQSSSRSDEPRCILQLVAFNTWDSMQWESTYSLEML